jgi:hypothetical protein
MFFFEKKNQKIFACLGAPWCWRVGLRARVKE